ncbi:recombinational DNA repair protein (RecF pathway) [Bradyrhizobium diazoefficiens]
MEWTDEGIVLGVRRHGESSAIVELLTRAHGPPSRSRARRCRLADAALAATGQQR